MKVPRLLNLLIVVQGHLDAAAVDWLEGMTVVQACDQQQQLVSVLTGELLEQSALSDVLCSLYNLRFPVLFVQWQHWSTGFEDHITPGENSHEDA